MKLSVSAFRAHTNATKKILSSYQTQLNYGATGNARASAKPRSRSPFPSIDPQMMVDKTGVGPDGGGQGAATDSKQAEEKSDEKSDEENSKPSESKSDESQHVTEKTSSGTRTKSNQRWMKLRTTVQISSAVGTKTKPPLKREDSFLKRFSTRQVPQTQETLDTGDDGEGGSGSQSNLEDTAARRKRRRRLRHSKSVVNPDENFFFYWLLIITICVLYNLWTLIVRQSFPELQMSYSTMWFSCDAFTDVAFLLDIIVQFRTGYLEQGLMVYNSKKLAGHYIKSNSFLFDIMALVPLDLIQFNVGINPILRFPRFLKVYRVYDYYYMVESRTVYPNLWRVINLIHILLVLAHWFGCFYYLLSEAEGFQGDWVYPYRPGEYATLTRKYLGSLYWSTLTLTTIGDLPTPETNAEYIFTIVSYLIGMFIFATIVGQVGNVITNRNANRLEFERLLDGAKTYMRHHKVPGGMKRRVLRWYDYSWSRGRIQGGGDINTALGLLPDKLKTELALHVNLSVLKKVTIFQECQPEFLHDLVLKMKAYIFTPGDLICRKGEVAREMFIIADGILEVISESGRVLTTMKAGDFFGEIGILNLDGLNKRTADVRSVGYSELFSLSREDVLTAMKDYPEAQEILQSLGRKRLMEARNINRNYKAAASDKKRKQASPPSSDNGDHKTGKKIVDKIRSDVKGLRNVLRKSRRGTRTRDESMELEPLTNVSSGQREGHNKGLLCRMPRVWSDETSQEEDAPAPPPEPKTEGLSLLQRIKIYKEKQDKEKAAEEAAANRLSGGEETKKDQIQEPSGKDGSSASGSKGKESESIGVGLPLLQRLLLLKQKEDREAQEIKTAASNTAEILASTVRTQQKSPIFKPRKKSKDSIPPPICQTGLNQVETTKNTIANSSITKKENVVIKKSADAQAVSGSKLPGCGTREGCSSVSVEPGGGGSGGGASGSETKRVDPRQGKPWSLLKKATVLSIPVDLGQTKPTCSQTSGCSETDACCSNVATAPKATASANISSLTKTVDNSKHVRINSIAQSFSSDNTRNCGERSVEAQLDNKIEVKSESSAITTTVTTTVATTTTSRSTSRRTTQWTQIATRSSIKRPNLVKVGQDIRMYKSIEDLSPEYSGLPFVKKLKILNERQKLAELERDAFLRSTSLDSSGENENAFHSSTLTRSHSEAIAIEVVLRNQQFRREAEVATAAASRPSTLPNTFNVTATTTTTTIASSSSSVTTTPLVSPESNETQERKHLKSILKKLSSNNLLSKKEEEEEEETPKHQSEPPSTTSSVSKADQNMKKLMRAQTFEGYAARHSKLLKSVTFNRDTLQSPPATALSPSVKDFDVHFSLPVISPSNVILDDKMVQLAAGVTSDHSLTNVEDRTHQIETSLQSTTQIEKSISPSRNPDLIPDVDRIPTAVDASTPVDVIAAQFAMCVTTNSMSTTPTVLAQQTNITCSTQTDSSSPILSGAPQPPGAAGVAGTGGPGPPGDGNENDSSFGFPVEPLSLTQYTNSVQKSFRPESILLPSHSLEEEYFNDILNGIKHVIQGHLEDVQTKFKTKIVNLEKEVKTRDEIIIRLQHKIQKLESGNRHSSEEEFDSDSDMNMSDEYSDQPFMRGDSVDTVVGPPDDTSWSEETPRYKNYRSNFQCNRRSWEDHSEEENLELQDLPRSITPQPMWTTVEIGSESSDSAGSGSCSFDSEHSASGDLKFRKHDCNWEIQMLARELDRRDLANRTAATTTATVSEPQRRCRFRKHKTRSMENSQMSELLIPPSPETTGTGSGVGPELFPLNPKSLASYNLNPSLRNSKLRNESVSRSSTNLPTNSTAGPTEGSLLYQKSLSIGSLHSSISSSVRRGFHLLRSSNSSSDSHSPAWTSVPSSTSSVSSPNSNTAFSPDVVPTISQACLPPPPPPNI